MLVAMNRMRIVGMAVMVLVVAGTIAWLSLTPATRSTAAPGPAPTQPPERTPLEPLHDDDEAPDEFAEAPPGPPGRLCLALSCTAAQREVIDPLNAEYDRRAADLRKDILAQRTELEPLWQADPLDLGAVRAVAEDIEATRRGLEEAALETLVGAHAVLTPSQREKLARMVSRRGFVGALDASRRRRRSPPSE